MILFRHISNELCEAHNLSVIRENKHLAKSYKERQASKNGTSWKSKLKTDIDKTIKCSHSYEEFIFLIQAAGYEIRDLSFDKQLKDAGEILRYARQYSEKHKYEVAYEKSKEPERYYRDHREDIQLAWGARTGLESLGLNPTTLKLSEIEEYYRKAGNLLIFNSFKSIMKLT